MLLFSFVFSLYALYDTFMLWRVSYDLCYCMIYFVFVFCITVIKLLLFQVSNLQLSCWLYHLIKNSLSDGFLLIINERIQRWLSGKWWLITFRILMNLIIDIFLKFHLLNKTVKLYGLRWKHIDMQLAKEA